MTTGDPVVVVGAMKPLPTLAKPLRSVDTETQGARSGAARAHRLLHGARRRSGGEAMVALVLAAAYREKLGGDHIDDARAALRAYQQRIGWRRA